MFFFLCGEERLSFIWFETDRCWCNYFGTRSRNLCTRMIATCSAHLAVVVVHTYGTVYIWEEIVLSSHSSVQHTSISFSPECSISVQIFLWVRSASFEAFSSRAQFTRAYFWPFETWESVSVFLWERIIYLYSHHAGIFGFELLTFFLLCFTCSLLASSL